MKIVKELRVAKFAARTILKPNQEMLIKWMDDYKINTDDSVEDKNLAKKNEAVFYDRLTHLDYVPKYPH